LAFSKAKIATWGRKLELQPLIRELPLLEACAVVTKGTGADSKKPRQGIISY